MPIVCQSCLAIQPIAYFCVQLLAVPSYFVLSVLYMCAISGTRGSSGLGSVSREQIESKTCNRFTDQNTHQNRRLGKTYRIPSAYTHTGTQELHPRGLHCSLRISRQMLPLLLIFGWKTFVLNATCTNGVQFTVRPTSQRTRYSITNVSNSGMNEEKTCKGAHPVSK
jgi:hypothetical protein